MQFTVTINQAKALEWGLNSQQALLFAFVFDCPSWAELVKTDHGDLYALSMAKIIEELPLLTDKPDYAYRLLKALESAELVELLDGPVEAFRLTEKAKSWSPAYRPDCWTQTPRNAYQRRRSNKKPIPQGVRALVFERDGWACLRCGCSKQHRLRADHVVPESKGGLATLQNLQTLCMTCNSWKGVKTIDFRAGDGGAA